MTKLLSAFVDHLSMKAAHRIAAKPATTAKPVAKGMEGPKLPKLQPHRPTPDYRLRESHLL
jgi:hypothetical protein